MRRFFVVTLMFAMLMLSSQAFGSYGADVATDRKSVTLGILGENKLRTISITALHPLKPINGFVRGYFSQAANMDGEIVSEIRNIYGQGGYQFDFEQFKRIGLEAYIELTTDKWKGIALDREYGYFLRPGIYDWLAVSWSGGVGNYSQQRSLDALVGREDTETTFGWLMFVTGQWQDVTGIARWKPEFGGDNYVAEASVTWVKELSDSIDLNLTGRYERDTSLEDSDHTGYLITFTYVPDKG